jgi:hypothetical protein
VNGFLSVLIVSRFSVCKFKAHKRCAVKGESRCKWTTLASVGPAIIEQEDGVGVSFASSMQYSPHAPSE